MVTGAQADPHHQLSSLQPVSLKESGKGEEGREETTEPGLVACQRRCCRPDAERVEKDLSPLVCSESFMCVRA